MSTNKWIFGGVPTEPEVKKLLEAFGAPKPGTILTHEEIETMLGYSRRQKPARYRTVVNRWKKDLFREENIDIQSKPGVGYEILTAERRVDVVATEHGRLAKRQRRNAIRGLTIPEEKLSDGYRKKFGHVMSAVKSSTEAAMTQHRLLVEALKVQQLPRGR